MSKYTGITDPSPYQLARVADVLGPDDKDSPGAKWLVRVSNAVDDVVDAVKNHDANQQDAEHEAADGLVPIYTHELWQVWVDLGLYREDPEEIGFEFDGQNVENLPSVVCYMVALRLLRELIGDLEDVDEEQEQEEEREDGEEGGE